MTFTTIFIIAGVVLAIIFFLIGKLAIRWAIRVAIVVVILGAGFGGWGFWWWGNRLIADSPKPRPKFTRPTPMPTRRTPTPCAAKTMGKSHTDDAADPVESGI